MANNKLIALFPLLIFFSNNVCYGADCEKALFGWATESGKHIAGTLANEGVSAKNPRGYQNLASDSGNFRNGKNCGGTAFGLACAYHPEIDVTTVTREQAIKIYHDDQWRCILGDDLASQYIAYKLFDFSINMGGAPAAWLFEATIDELNGKALDFPKTGHVTHEMILWVNAYTKSDILPENHVPRFSGDWGPGGHDSTRRQLFIETFKAKTLERYGDIIRHDPKKLEWWDNWKLRDMVDE